jgi:hypothetical protein
MSWGTRPPRGAFSTAGVSVALAALLLLVFLAGSAEAKRPPTPAERHALVAALSVAGGSLAGLTIWISSVDPHYASVSQTSVPGADLWGRGHGGWAYLSGFSAHESADGACAFAPTTVVRDLYRVACPPWAATHARPATAAERAQLLEAFHSTPVTRYLGYLLEKLDRPCVSRLDPDAAAAGLQLSGGGGLAWFRRTNGVWRSVYETVGASGVRPSHAIVLSLASCVGYNAAQESG